MNTRVLFLQAQVAPGFASSTATQKSVLTLDGVSSKTASSGLYSHK